MKNSDSVFTFNKIANLSGVVASGAVGSLGIGARLVAITGSQAMGQVGNLGVFYWSLIDDDEIADWQNINNGQTSGWSNIDDNQSANWQNVNNAQNPSWGIVDDAETADWELIPTE